MDFAPPSSALVSLLLLLALLTPGSCCSFGFNPVSSTFSAHLNNLTPWLLLDYPVAMPSNLEPDGGCSDLWGLHFGALALQRMLGVAGEDLAPLLRTLLAQLHFVAECHIQDPQGCVRLETVNVSQLLETLARHLGALQGRPPHFPGCARLRCRPGTPPAPLRDPREPPRAAADPRLSPGPALSSPAARHEGASGARRGPPVPTGHGLLLLGGVGGALGLAAAAWALRRRPCAQVGTRGARKGAGAAGGDGAPGGAAGRGRAGGAAGDTGDAACAGRLGVTGRTGDTGSAGERWELTPLSPPQPSQGPPASEQDGT